jgi:hypothetical protein
VTAAGHRGRWLHPTLSQIITDDSHRSSPMILTGHQRSVLSSKVSQPLRGPPFFLAHLAAPRVNHRWWSENAFIKLKNRYKNKITKNSKWKRR